jgi:hypothetical protein
MYIARLAHQGQISTKVAALEVSRTGLTLPLLHGRSTARTRETRRRPPAAGVTVFGTGLGMVADAVFLTSCPAQKGMGTPFESLCCQLWSGDRDGER